MQFRLRLPIESIDSWWVTWIYTEPTVVIICILLLILICIGNILMETISLITKYSCVEIYFTLAIHSMCNN